MMTFQFLDLVFSFYVCLIAILVWLIFAYFHFFYGTGFSLMKFFRFSLELRCFLGTSLCS